VRATVVVLTKLPGHLPVKTRLVPLLGEAGAVEFHRSALRRTVELARRFDPEPTIATSPFDVDPATILQGYEDCRLMPVEGADGATCLEHALDLADEGLPLVALGADAPDLPAVRIEQGLASLDRCEAAVVPTSDGGFSCLVLRTPAQGLATAFGYGADDACTALCRWFERRGDTIALLEPWDDVDTPEQYLDYVRRLTLDV